MRNLVDVHNLRIEAQGEDGERFLIVKDVSFSIPKGEVLALIGESGSGKTTIALALMGYARRGCAITGGEILVNGRDMRTLSEGERRAMCGAEVTYVAQSAAASFNPSLRVMDQVIEPILVHGLMDRKAAEAKAVELFKALSLPNPEGIGRRYPHEVSGGQLQRLMAAMALITSPKLVIFDEPTTALDVTTQVEVLRTFKKAVQEQGATAVYVSHDLAVVAQMTDHIVVLQHGAVQETGTVGKVLDRAENPYTQSLLAAAKARTQVAPGEKAEVKDKPLLEVAGLYAGYGPRGTDGMPINCVLQDVDFNIREGTTYGVIGESGSGKSTTARVIAGLLEPARGKVLFRGEPLPPALKDRTKEQLQSIQIVFQNPDTALNPAHSVERILARPLEFYHGLKGAARKKRIAELLDQICLSSALMSRKCGELSGGQKQRINLARALAAEPDLILCDEITSALDTVVGAAILDLLADLRKDLGVSYMFISHDISTVRSICDDTLVLYGGRKVEIGSRASFEKPPFHPYTDLLISSVPEMRQGWLEATRARRAGKGLARKAGEAGLCCFLEDCPVALDGICNVKPPKTIKLAAGNEIQCHLSEEALCELQTADQLSNRIAG